VTGLLVCCGLATFDVVQRVERVPGPDEKAVALGLDVTFGGPAANAAATAVALGVPAALVTALGSGPVAALVRDGLAAAGVRVVDLAADEPGDPPVSTVLVTAATGQRAVVSTNATLRPDDLRPAALAAAGVLDGAGALLVDGHHLAAGIALAAAARERGLVVLADGGSWKPGLERLLALVDVAVLSADFVVPAGIAPPDPLVAVGALGPAFVARSAGAGPVRVRRVVGGAMVDDELVVPAVAPGEVVDTLGAGDVLHGAMGAALARGLDPLAALRAGIATATESVRHPGALGWAR
jgi:sugar/nucleoside kinase (ribokinase family)